MANIPTQSIKFPGLSDTYTFPQIDTSLTTEGKVADAKATGDAINDLKSALGTIPTGRTVEGQITEINNNKIPFPVSPDSKYGTNGQNLRSLGNGKTQWVDQGLPTDEQTAEAVSSWLDDHPEATTTVQDCAITLPKFSADVKEKLLSNGSAAFYFPSLETGGYSGSSSMMVTEGKTVLFDAAPELNKAAILGYYQNLYAAGLFENIDVIVISHYHWDHIQCLGDILEAFPHNNCVAYLPLNPSGYYTESDASDILADRQTVLNTLEEYGVQAIEISSDTTITVSDNFCEIELFNSNASDYTYYSSNTTHYNDYSMVALVKTGNIYAMLPGDIQRVAQDRIISQHDLPRLFLYVVHHHGMQNDDNRLFLDIISPEWAIQQTSHNRGLVSGGTAMAANYFSDHIGSSAYCSHVFVMQKDSGCIVDGSDIVRSGWYYAYFDLYVDNEYSGTVHNGTVDKPFTSINEVNLFIKDDRNLHFRIYVKATSTPYDLLWMRDYKCTVEFYGVEDGNISKPTINGVYIKACTNIYLYNFIFKTGRTTSGIASVAYVAESYAYFSDCDIDGVTKSSNNGVCVSLAHAYLATCTIKNVTEAFIPYRYGYVITNGITFDNVQACYRQTNCEITIRGNDSITSATYYIASTSNGAIPLKVSSAITLANLQTLCNSNAGSAVSELFRNGNDIYRIEGSSILKSSLKSFSTNFMERVADLNDAVSVGFYTYTNSASHRPTDLGANSGGLFVFGYSSSYFTQVATGNDGTNFMIAIRKCTNGTFGDWKYLTAS